MGTRRLKQRKITQLAKGQMCLIRLPSICNFNPETTVACHFRMAGYSGIGYIPCPLFIAFGCSDCHAWVDTHKDDATQLAFAHGVFRTIAALIEDGVIRWT